MGEERQTNIRTNISENNFKKPGVRPQAAYGQLWALAWLKNPMVAAKNWL